MIGRGGGQATITYSDACTQQVDVGQSVVVQTQSPCAALAPTTTPTTNILPSLSSIPAELAIIGGLGAAAVAAGIIVHSADSRKPASP